MKITGPILLVDDDEDDHDIFKLVCTRLGVCELFKHFTSGEELLGYLTTTSDKPFIIFCDINMPKMDGLQLREQLHRNERLRKKSIPFIFFSTAATASQVEKAYDLTVQGFFVKGTTVQETEQKFKLILSYWSECKHPNSFK